MGLRMPVTGRLISGLRCSSVILLLLLPVLFLESCLPESRDISENPLAATPGYVFPGKPAPLVSRHLSVMPRRHPDDRPYGVAVLSSLDEASTLHVLGELHRGLTSLGWLPPPSPEFGMIERMSQAKEYWAGLAHDGSSSLIFLPGLLGMTDGSPLPNAAWWKSLDKGMVGVDAVIFLGHDALLSYRYHETALNIPVFHYSPAAGETWFLAASFPPSRLSVPLLPGIDLHTDLGDFMKLLDGGPVMVAGDFDTVEKLAVRQFLDTMSTVYAGRAGVADAVWISRSPQDPAIRDFLAQSRPHGILVATRLPQVLEDRLIELSASGRIPLFCASGIGGRLGSIAVAWRDEFPEAELEKTMALQLVESFTGYPGQAGISGFRPRLGLDISRLHQAGLRLEASATLALPFREGGAP